jgi:peptide/nickel transport system substrate-binding protein
MTARFSRRSFTTGVLATSAGLGWPTRAEERQTLVVAVQADPVTLDPALMASFFEISVQFNLHEPLVNMKADFTLEPGLAAFERRDPLTYAFTLKQDLVFHDGSAIDAEAAKFNFDRMLDPATASPRRAELAPIDIVQVTGPLTFTIHLKTPYEPLLQVLALRAGMLVSPSAVTALGSEFGFRAVGAGPYKVVSWTKNSELRLERFDRYWRGPAPIERIMFRPIADEVARLTNLKAGTVQLVDSVPPQAVPSLSADSSLRLKRRPGLGFNAFSFNTTRPPFDDVRVRRAFVEAVDPRAIIQAAYFGQAALARGPVPPAISWAYDETLAVVPADPKEAKGQLEKTGISIPIPVAITIANSPIQIRVAEIIQAQAMGAGFSVSIRQVDAASLISILRKKDFDLCLSPWSGRSDPDGNMFGWFTKKGPQDFSGYQSDEVTEILIRARATTSQMERAGLYRQAQKRIAADAPMLFVAFPDIVQASARALEWEQFADGGFHLQFARWN